MEMKIVALPSRGLIVARSLCYGAGLGAGAGIVVLIVIGLLTVSPAIVVFAPIAAAIGSVFGACCGTLAGITLAAARSGIAGRPLAVRLTAGAGASLVPGAWEAALLGHTGFGAVGVGVLLAMTFWLAFEAGPAALYGKRHRRLPHVRVTASPGGRHQDPEPASAADASQPW